MTCNSAKVRSEEHVRQKFSVCSTDQQHLREGQGKGVEQFDDILRTVTNEMNKFENRFGKIRDEEKMLAVKKLLPGSLLNYRFRGTMMSYNELENIIVDKVATVPTARSRKHDTSAPMEIGMAAKEDGENVLQEGDRRIVGKWSFGKGQSWNEKGGKGGKDGGKNSWQKGSGKKGGEGQEKGGKGETRTCWTCGKTGHIAAWCWKGGNKNLYATDEDDSENVEKCQLRMKRICKHGVCWKRVKMSSGRR